MKTQRTVKASRPQLVFPVVPPPTFAELITKITVTPDTPHNFLTTLIDFEPRCIVIKSDKRWKPNVNALTYQRRRDERKKERAYRD